MTIEIGHDQFSDGVPAFDETKPCVLRTADPARTQCERCKNPHHKCDLGASGRAPYVTLDEGDAHFLAVRLRRLCARLNYTLPEFSKDDRALINIAGSVLGALLTNTRGMETVYFRRQGSATEDSVRVAAGTASFHVRSDLITRIVPDAGEPVTSLVPLTFDEWWRSKGYVFGRATAQEAWAAARGETDVR